MTRGHGGAGTAAPDVFDGEAPCTNRGEGDMRKVLKQLTSLPWSA